MEQTNPCDNGQNRGNTGWPIGFPVKGMCFMLHAQPARALPENCSHRARECCQTFCSVINPLHQSYKVACRGRVHTLLALLADAAYVLACEYMLARPSSNLQSRCSLSTASGATFRLSLFFSKWTVFSEVDLMKWKGTRPGTQNVLSPFYHRNNRDKNFNSEKPAYSHSFDATKLASHFTLHTTMRSKSCQKLKTHSQSSEMPSKRTEYTRRTQLKTPQNSDRPYLGSAAEHQSPHHDLPLMFVTSSVT
jgi:hypothetical protein